MTPTEKPFHVIAGKIEDEGMNVKYADSFETLDEAINAFDQAQGYPARYIQYENRFLDLTYNGFSPFEK